MLSQLRITIPATTPVVDLDLLCRHARIDSTAERDLMALYCSAATSSAEKFLGRCLMTQTLAWTISQAVPQAAYWNTPYAVLPINYEGLRVTGGTILELPYAPVSSVLTVSTSEWGASDVALTSGVDYDVDLSLDPARLRLSLGWSWGTYKHLTVSYMAGYASAAAIPQPIVHAVMMMATNLYENRGDTAEGGMSQTVKHLLTPYRVAWNA